MIRTHIVRTVPAFGAVRAFRTVGMAGIVGAAFMVLSLGAAPGHAQSVRINEFMADNDSIESPVGRKNDWIELYNTTAAPVNLTGFYLSDNPDNPTKWQFPAGTTIPAHGYLVVWAYDTTYSGPALYAGWALSKDGEHIRLSGPDQSVMDSVTFGPQVTNRTVARIPNGTGSFTSSCRPTLGQANNCSGTSLAGNRVVEARALDLARAGTGRIAARFALEAPVPVRLSVHDVRGREVALLHEGRLAAGVHHRVFDAGRLPAGTYWFRLRAGGVETMRTGVIMR